MIGVLDLVSKSITGSLGVSSNEGGSTGTYGAAIRDTTAAKLEGPSAIVPQIKLLQGVTKTR